MITSLDYSGDSDGRIISENSSVNGDTMPRISVELIKSLCKDQNLFQTPYLNDKLFLHYKGFKKIENLEIYTELKALWLEGNAIQRIENLEAQDKIRCLYLQQNVIRKIEGLDHMIDLQTLNLSGNQIKTIENLSECKKITTLNLSHNQIQDIQDLYELETLTEIHSLDLSFNEIDDDTVIALLMKLPKLGVLHLRGNPVVEKIPHYRKTLLVNLPQLHYLDESPVTEDERRAANAWVRGGPKLEQEERRRIQEEKLKKHKENLIAYKKQYSAAKQRREQNEDVLDARYFSNYGREFEEEESDEIETSPVRKIKVVSPPRRTLSKDITYSHTPVYIPSLSPRSPKKAPKKIYKSPGRHDSQGQQNASPQNRTEVSNLVDEKTSPSKPESKITFTVTSNELDQKNNALIDKVHEVIEALKGKLLPGSPGGTTTITITQGNETAELNVSQPPSEHQTIATTDSAEPSHHQEVQRDYIVSSGEPYWNNSIRDLLLKLVRKYLFDFKEISNRLINNLRCKYPSMDQQKHVILVPSGNKKVTNGPQTLVATKVSNYSEEECRREYSRIMKILESIIGREGNQQVDSRKVRQVVKATWREQVVKHWNETQKLLV
ncbi:dynein assembly factor DNAAF1 [Acrasis kona]|uniref:Dynein assembly factor DNAAF1 n=1 Tax=Acrasis kona TaxID=1008807 RepID=A0AAW2ZEU6_9EUKA